jgi:osmotically-inducible protein OsmY
MRTLVKSVAIAVLVVLAAGVVAPNAQAAEPPQVRNLTASFQAANAAVDRLQVFELAGVLVIRGRTANRAEAEAIGRYALAQGYARVANLVQIVENDDVEIARAAERELTIHRSLDGCRFRVTADKGVVHVAGTVSHELQKDVAAQILRSIDGVRGIEMNLDKF